MLKRKSHKEETKRRVTHQRDYCNVIRFNAVKRKISKSQGRYF